MSGCEKKSIFSNVIELFLDLFPQHRELKAEWEKQNKMIDSLVAKKNTLELNNDILTSEIKKLEEFKNERKKRIIKNVRKFK